MRRLLRLGPAAGILAALAVAFFVLYVRGRISGPGAEPPAPATLRHVPEDASGPLKVVAIHYAPAFDQLAMGVWKQLFAVLPESVDVRVAVQSQAHFDRLMAALGAAGIGHLDRFHAVIVGEEITTWSRDRFAALEGPGGAGGILAPPQIGVPFKARAGDWHSPFAIARALYGKEPRIADFVFEGGDLASSPRFLFVDANLGRRNQGRADATRERLEEQLGHYVDQKIVWLGDKPGDVPQHHIMMYMVPLDETTVAVGDVRAGMELIGREPAAAGLRLDPDVDGDAKRFDHAAELLAARGFTVVRPPVVVLEGAGAYVTYTNALFDVDPSGRKVVYLPTYRLPLLDDTAERFYAERGYLVHRIDVQPIYGLNGSLGCLVNVVRRL